VVVAQGMGAWSEVVGQRLGRVCHHHSQVRMLVSASLYCSVQAGVVLAAAQLALPTSVTGGQGPLTMWAAIADHPPLLVNAVNNAVYFAAMVAVLREPMGPLLVVLAFLAATFAVVPLQRAIGMAAAGSLTPGVVVLGVAGALTCAIDLPRPLADAAAAACCRRGRHVLPDEPSSPPVEDTPATSAPTAAGDGDGGDGEGDGIALVTVRGSASRYAVVNAAATVPSATTESSGADGNSNDDAGQSVEAAAAAASVPPRPTALGAVAFFVLAATTAIGITLATYFETAYGMNSFGYTAVDQVLLPFTMLPLAALIDSTRLLRRAVGEPPWSAESAVPPHFGATLARTWREVNALVPALPHPPPQSPAGGGGGITAWCRRTAAAARLLLPRPCAARRTTFWWTLVPFHALEFGRTLLFFYLVTAFDVEATYLTMTLLRIAMCWVASLLTCWLWRGWSGVTDAEAAAALHPVALALRGAGCVALLASVAALKGLLPM